MHDVTSDTHSVGIIAKEDDVLLVDDIASQVLFDQVNCHTVYIRWRHGAYDVKFAKHLTRRLEVQVNFSRIRKSMYVTDLSRVLFDDRCGSVRFHSPRTVERLSYKLQKQYKFLLSGVCFDVVGLEQLFT